MRSPRHPTDGFPALRNDLLVPPEWFRSERRSAFESLAALPAHKGKVWLDVPYEDRKRAREFGARWDYKRHRWYAVDPCSQLMKWGIEDPGLS
ncbi:DUF5710 domain-containing protein [Actinacidiphila oryziradicis]|uniref:DUF5710 domain-containing protein n=1 Tax=Actinacidiphila oryziradicis TaxID=2571141 RepID=UPI0026CB0D6A